MIKPISLSLTIFCLQTALAQAQVATPTNVKDLVTLRSCAQAVSKSIEGSHIRADWGSDDQDSIYYLNCNDDVSRATGEDYYIITPSGVYYYFIKPHKDYKGGAYGALYRVKIENRNYYFSADITNSLGGLYDESGNNLSCSVTDPDYSNIDPSSKNPVLAFYMKVITGSSDPKSAVLAEPATGDRLEKAAACMESKINKLAESLAMVYEYRVKYRQVPPETLVVYKATLENALKTPECSVNKNVADNFLKLLANMPQ